jgi:phosphoribosylanthranilate isomerase
LAKSIYIALKKRPIDTETVEKFISKISRALEELGQSEISTNTIGTMVMEGLKDLIQLHTSDLHLFIETLEKKKTLYNSWTNLMSTKKDKFSIKDKFYMGIALKLAISRQGHTGSNPSVGCVIVKNDKIISIGQTSL